ncbi:MAG: hypothetical protein BM562_16420 [Alphaproteobacteria bacterium MedPE-SWcel]|nr:MAG: hypothetical protein BM562_16420 [Alphaproteobacteria bacterium MedPE-SWcel]
MSHSTVRLGDVCDFVNGGAWNQSDYADAGYPVVQVSNIKKEGFDLAGQKFLNSEKFNQYKRHQIRSGDLIIATVGSHPSLPSAAGRAAVANDAIAGMLLNQNAVLMRSCSPELYQSFLCRIGQSRLFQDYVQNAGKGAANQIRIGIGAIKAFEVEIPPLQTQERIAGILSAYDDLIENNRRRIALLEQAARLLYREWFVHFRFPGSETTKFVDGLPEGWKRRPISEIWDISYGKNLPKTKITETGTYPVHGADGIIGFFEKENVSESMCLVTCRGNGSGNVRRTFGPTFVTNNCFVFRPKHKADGIRFHFAMNACETLRMQDMRTGAAQPQLTLAGISHVNSIVPEDDTLQSYNEIADPIWSEADNLRRQNQKLANARDLLLPRLMDGRIPIPE